MHAYVVPQSRKVGVFNRIAPDGSSQTCWRSSSCKLLRQELSAILEVDRESRRATLLSAIDSDGAAAFSSSTTLGLNGDFVFQCWPGRRGTDTRRGSGPSEGQLVWCFRFSSETVRKPGWRGQCQHLLSPERQTPKELPHPHRQASMRNLAATTADLNASSRGCVPPQHR